MLNDTAEFCVYKTHLVSLLKQELISGGDDQTYRYGLRVVSGLEGSVWVGGGACYSRAVFTRTAQCLNH